MGKKLILSTFFITVIAVVVFFGKDFLFREDAEESKRVLHFSSLEYSPYYGEKLKGQGFVTEIVKAVAKGMGHEMDVDFLPWERALRNGREGVYDGVYTMWYTSEREKDFVFSDPLPPNEIVFFALKDSEIVFDTLEELKEYNIGIVKDYAYPQEFFDANLNTVSSLFQKQNFQKLINGDVSLTVEDKAVGVYMLEEEFSDFADKIEIVGSPLTSSPQYVVFSRAVPDHQKLVNEFNQSLKKVIQSGEFNSILEKHGYLELFYVKGK